MKFSELRSFGMFCALGSLLLASPAFPQTIGPPTLPGDVQYRPSSFGPGIESAYLASNGTKPENYTLRVRLKPDAKIPPHTHPDARMIVVLSGEVFAGIGNRFDPSQGALLPAGSFLVIPPGAAHWVWAKNSETVYQEFGTGPTATNLLK